MPSRHLASPIGVARVQRDSFDTGWIANSNWSSDIRLGNTPGSNLIHSLGTPLRSLAVEIYYSSSGNDEDAIYIGPYIYPGNATSSQWHGTQLYEINSNELLIITGEVGVRILSSTDGTFFTPSGGYYRIVVTKKQPSTNLVSADSAYRPRKFETPWIANNDWTSQSLGNSPGSNLVHGLGKHLRELQIKILVSSDGTDATSTDITYLQSVNEGGTAALGIGTREIDQNTIVIFTNTSGIAIFSNVGSVFLLNTQAWYYKILVKEW